MIDIQTENKKINTSILYKDFSSHLNIEGNNRIFFSAKFGSGKTTYLNEYFEANKDKYEVFKLYPVNYSVANNEDIFELIKYDLILELLLRERNGDIKFEKIEFGIFLLLQQFVLKNVATISTSLAITELIEKLNKDNDAISMVATGATAGFTLFESIKKFFDKNNIDNSKDVKHILNELENKKGSIHEYNNITQIIKNCIDELTVKNEKESVLIIDDLDRLDPDHIFRLLNIFSAHNDINNSNNKFGFSKIILVGDIENIQHIFEHRYGPKTDFEGYINKFYSIAPYEFKLIDILADHLKNLFNYPITLSEYAKKSWENIVISLIKFNLLHFRDFINYQPNYNIKQTVPIEDNIQIKLEYNELFELYYFFKPICNNIITKLKKLDEIFSYKKMPTSDYVYKLYFDSIIILLDKYDFDNPIEYKLENHTENIILKKQANHYVNNPYIDYLSLSGEKRNNNIILRTIIRALIKLDKLLNP